VAVSLALEKKKKTRRRKAGKQGNGEKEEGISSKKKNKSVHLGKLYRLKKTLSEGRFTQNTLIKGEMGVSQRSEISQGGWVSFGPFK